MPELDGPDAPADIELGGGVAYLHTPSIPSRGGLALTHGAGGNCESLLLQRIAAVWSKAGFTVLRFDLPFRVRKPKGPPHPSRSAEDRLGIAAAIDRLRVETSGFIAFGGHSYGGRQGSMIAAERPDLVDGLVLTSYPLHPPGKPEKARTQHLPELRTPTVVVHGTKDPFGTTAELSAALALVPAPTLLVDIEGAGHDLAPIKYDAATRTLAGAVSLFSDSSVVVPPFDPLR
ncbi:alpha/beta fold hydrolase [Rhodococcus ruber]|uniref:Alpha/beta fold hydrolase n=1 Tax=Rhodococcus ruber TaxID=1830 RepID=A0ABT4MC96_9NOCA|nr:alpha/beta fold hydrolase [Rhodococcus ruber]MCZ4518359.1 alpha/beta fold hydrolase [Rhodococcus ruber]